jgi:phosphoglycerol transferase
VVPSVRVTVVLAVLVGAAFTYYAVFALLLIGFAVVVAFAYGRREAALRGVLALAVIGAVLALAHVPTWIYHLQHGSNAALATLHTPQQSETFGLKLPRLLLPVEGHRIAPLARLTSHFDSRSPSQLAEGPPQALGLLAAAGFIALLWIALTGAFRRDRERREDPYLRAAATGATAAFVLGVVGGGALLVAYTISPLLRSWSRLSILIAFFALIAVGKGIDRLGKRLATRGLRPAVLGLGLCLIVALATADQTSSAMVPHYRTAALWRSDAAFASAAALALPRGSMVLELPYTPFPESGYSEERPFLHTDGLRWTFGAMSGRPADWTAALSGLPPKTVATEAAAAGANGIYVDRSAYQDGGRAITAALTGGLGPPVAGSPSSQVELFDLRPYAARVRARLGSAGTARLADLVLHPVQVLPGSDLSAPYAGGSAPTYYRLASGRTAHLDLVNPAKRPRQVGLTVKITARGSGRTFTLALPGGQGAQFRASPSATGTGTVTLQPGHNRLTITAATPSQQAFSIDEVQVQDPEVQQLVNRAE